MEQQRPCFYCSGNDETLYQTTNHTALSIDTFGKYRVLVTRVNACPPFAECCMKGNPVTSAFIINYCPNCGRKLSE